MKRLILLIPILLTLTQCSSSSSRSSSSSASANQVNRGGRLQQIINVSAYDPKARARNGQSYSPSNLTALRSNGAKGLIARAGKGGKLDEKCATFIASADRAGLLAGVYYRVQKHVSITRQADQFIARARTLNRYRPAGAAPLLLCGDYDGDLSLSAILTFMDRVESKTGVVPVAYLENSQALKIKMSQANSRTKARIRRAPYWLALYSHESGKGPIFDAPGTPDGLVKQYNMWSNWTLWQYGGVNWENGASSPKVYSHGRYRFPKYFGRMDRPMERNVFRGSYKQLSAFWARHGLANQ